MPLRLLTRSTRPRFVRAWCRPLLVTVLLAAGVSCKPTGPSNKDKGLSTPNELPPQRATGNSHPPTRDEFATFFRADMASYARLADVQMDAPVPMPNTSPADNVWLCEVKITLASSEDLLVHAPAGDVQAIDALVNELNGLVNWRNLYIHSPYAHACGDLEIKVPAASVPQLLVVKQPKDKPLPPIYGKMAAEWQVDHWQFSAVDLNLVVDGKPRGDFEGGTMIKGSQEAESFFRAEREAIAQAKQQIEAIRTRYVEQVARGTKPGTTYHGQIAFHQFTLPCDLRFMAPPPGGDARFAAFEVTLRDDPSYRFEYRVKLVTELPVTLPDATTASTSEYAVPIVADAPPVPKSNLTFSLARSSGKEDTRTVPGQMLMGARHNLGQDRPLLLLGGHLDGMISYYQAPFTLAVQQNQ